MPERSEGANKGLRVINFVVPCVFKSNVLDQTCSCTFAAACNKLMRNVAVISSDIAW